MIKASKILQEASRLSQTFSFRADLVRNGVVVEPGLPVVSSSFTGDRTSKTRLNCDLSLALWPWQELTLNARSYRVRLYQGVTSLGFTERLMVGEFRIDRVQRYPGGSVDVSCSGLESYIIDARFLYAKTPPLKASTTRTIVELIKEILPLDTVRNESTTNRTIKATAPWQRERWDAIEYLADSISSEVFADARGGFVIRDNPTLSTGTPVIHINEGENGLLVEEMEGDTRDQVYNAASVSGMSSDPATPPVWGLATVSDPQDELYYYGPFGQVPIFYTSQFFSTNAQCVAYAKELLVTAKAKNSSLTFQTPPTLWWLEVGDLVQVDRLDGTAEVHLLQKMSGDLGGSTSLRFDTMSTKVAARTFDE